MTQKQKILLKDIKPLGVFADSYRFEARDLVKNDKVYFKFETINSSEDNKKAIKIVREYLFEYNVYLSYIEIGTAMFYNDRSNLGKTPKDCYILYVNPYSPIPDEDTPF